MTPPNKDLLAVARTAAQLVVDILNLEPSLKRQEKPEETEGAVVTMSTEAFAILWPILEKAGGRVLTDRQARELLGMGPDEDWETRANAFKDQ